MGTPQQRRIEVTRDPTSNLVTERRLYDAAGTLKAKTAWTYNARRQVLAITRTDPGVTPNAARTTTLAYCEPVDVAANACPFVGLLKSIDGPRTDVTDVVIFAYRLADAPGCAGAPATCAYRKGDLWKTTNAMGHVVEVTASDGAGRPLSIKDPDGVVTDFSYTPRGWPSAQKVRGANPATETDDRVTLINYFPFGQPSRIRTVGASDATFSYDAAHRLTTLGDNQGFFARFTLNSAGQRIAEAVQNNSGTTTYRSLSRSIDSLGRVLSQTDGYGRVTGFSYDADGNPNQTTDALGRIADHDYDPLDRLMRTLQDMGGLAAQTQFSYDALDNLIQVNDPNGLNTTYAYNGFSELTAQTSPDTGTAIYAYDSAGNRVSQTDARGKVTQYAYDALNRLTAVTYPGESSLNVVYVYDITTGMPRRRNLQHRPPEQDDRRQRHDGLLLRPLRPHRAESANDEQHRPRAALRVRARRRAAESDLSRRCRSAVHSRCPGPGARDQR